MSSQSCPQSHQLSGLHPHSAPDQFTSPVAHLPDHVTDLLTSDEDEYLGAQREPGCSSKSATAALRPSKRPRIAACLAIPSVRTAPGASQTPGQLTLDQQSDDDADYLPSAAEQAEAGAESSCENEDDDGGMPLTSIPMLWFYRSCQWPRQEPR